MLHGYTASLAQAATEAKIEREDERCDDDGGQPERQRPACADMPPGEEHPRGEANHAPVSAPAVAQFVKHPRDVRVAVVAAAGRSGGK